MQVAKEFDADLQYDFGIVYTPDDTFDPEMGASGKLNGTSARCLRD
jgi:hypothetical protein